MVQEAPTILIASVSTHEWQRVARLLEDGGGPFPRVAVGDAETAERIQTIRSPACVLVIDSGLLHAHRDEQWRALRMRHPSLGAIVRCLVPYVLRADSRTFHVPPDDGDGIRRAVGILTAAEQPSGPERRRQVG